MLTEQNIAKLFTAALVPGILAALGYMAVIAIVGHYKPEWVGNTLEKMPWRERFKALAAIWPVLTIFIIVIGGINFGVFTPTEGAAVGVVATGVLAWLKGGLNKTLLLDSFEITAAGTAMIFLIVLGAAAFNNFMALSELPQALAVWVGEKGWSPFGVLIAIVIFYLVAGCFLDSLSMILLTIPIFFPMISALDFYGLGLEEKAIWFGIITLIVVEVGLITPPVGMNLFVIQSMAPGVAMKDIFRGVLPFVVSDLIRTVVIIAFPAISLTLLRWIS
jgi:C4-dicarboxylate transporter, DctM subunit